MIDPLYFILMIVFTFILLLQLIPLLVYHGSTSIVIKHNGEHVQNDLSQATDGSLTEGPSLSFPSGTWVRLFVLQSVDFNETLNASC